MMQRGEFFHIAAEDCFVRNEDKELSDKSLEIFKGEFKPEKVLVFHKTRGRSDSDIFRNSPLLLVVSERFISALRSINASGWSASSAKIMDKGKELKGNYFALSITGRSGVLNPSNSRNLEQERSDGIKIDSKEIGIEVDKSTWDGSDLFLSDASKSLICSVKVKEALERHDLKRLRIRDLYYMNITPMAKKAYEESLK